MSGLVSYEHDAEVGVATLTMDDGKVNVMSIPMLAQLHECFERAAEDHAVVLLTGRRGVFSAGFDMKVFGQGREPTLTMLRLGATLAERILSFPFPVVTACAGHAFPMGAFLMLSADRRIGVDGAFRIGMNEVAIGITLPYFAVEIARHRLAPAAFHRVVTGDMYTPRDAVAAGFLDEVVSENELIARSREVAAGLTEIDYAAHHESKLRIREQALSAVREAIDRELEA